MRFKVITNQSIIVWKLWFESISFAMLELDSGFRRSDESCRVRFFVVIPAEAGIQDHEEIRAMSRLLCPR